MKHFKEFIIFESKKIDKYKLPEIIYHATPAENVDSILKTGLIPNMKDHVADNGEIHQDRIFLSIYNNPVQMNLPEDKINNNLKILKISTNGLNDSDFYPDDSLYWAFYNDDLTDDALAIIFPKYYRKYKHSDDFDDVGFGEWLIDNDLDVSNAELENILKGKFYFTLPDNNLLVGYDAGEIAYKGIIPPHNIISVADVTI